MKPGFIFLLIVSCFLQQCSGGNEKDNEATVGSALEDRARIIMLDGNVFLYAGATKNISFVADTGGGIYLGAVDVRSLPNKTQVETLNLLLGSNSEVMKNLHQSVSATERQVPQLRREITGIKMRQSIVMGMLRRMNDTRNRNRNNQRVRKTLATLTRQVDKLYKLVNQDDCLNAPCKNGGTCIDLMGGYKCLCPKHFVGKHCQEREDECQMYSGTHAGCQNNATCINNQNITGFTCNCTKGYHGPLCQYTQSSCNQAILLCGEHGHCVDRLNGGGQSSYDCICDWGYRKTVDPINPTCIDIDECANSPCFLGSNCLNLPGSFKCESCPPGYVGNGVTCHDFDECASKLSHGCSRNPETECINTVGGYKCGPCPSGYKGNGFRCEPLKYCDNNPCVATATCLEHEAACMCPAGYMGDGIKEGGTGCELIYYTCMSLTCSNGGSCRYVHPKPGETPVQRCYCPAGFHGPQCEYEDLCAQSDYCNGHGNCTKSGNTASCNCYPGYYDDRCQTTEAPGCSFHTYNETGSVEFHPEYDSSAAQYRAPACAWVINLRDTRKVVELWFDYFEQDSTNTSTCENRDSLIVFDTNTKPIDLIADFFPRNTTPIYSSSNSLNINYFFANSANKSRVKMNWRAVEPICGGRLIDQTGTFEYTSSRAFEHCSWYISVKAGYYLEVTVESMVMASTDLRNCSINQIEIALFTNRFKIFDDSFIGNDPARVAQLCQTDSTPTIRRLSGRNAVVHLSYNSYNASDEYLDNCRMRTTSANNSDQNPKCKVYLRVSYKSIQLPDNCGGEIKLLDFNSMEDSTGYIESPNYGHAYFPNLNCLWSLDASDAFNNSLFQDLGMIRLEFVDLDVDSDGLNKDIFGDPSCPGDYIKLSTMPDERFCNAHRPKIVFAREKMEIEFVTNGQSKYKSRGTGFRIKYQTMCYQELKAANGTIQSPNYRFPSPVPFKCHYHIASSPQATVKINFDYIGLRPFSMACIHPRFANNITDDYVEFAGGHSSNIQINRRYYCSRYPFSAPNGEFVASGNKGLSFVYSTSGDKENTGFLFHYEIEHIGCGGYSIGMSGRIQSPNYPEIYPPNLYCIYTILLFKPKDLSIYQTHGVRLTFDTFNVENIASRDDCGFDAVRVYEHYRDENNTGKLLGRFCGVRTPPPILTTHSTMAIVFLSDRSVSGTGFSAHWEAVNLAKDCNRVFNEPSGLITFDSDDFEDVTTCDYIIVLPTMNRIELTIENMTLPCDEGRIMFRFIFIATFK
ncbi:putative cubilin [Aphelenchoides bicaudatus]|nr:putative cubilin [Aphelenchoides bicaudatus]